MPVCQVRAHKLDYTSSDYKSSQVLQCFYLLLPPTIHTHQLCSQRFSLKCGVSDQGELLYALLCIKYEVSQCWNYVYTSWKRTQVWVLLRWLSNSCKRGLAINTDTFQRKTRQRKSKETPLFVPKLHDANQNTDELFNRSKLKKIS